MKLSEALKYAESLASQDDMSDKKKTAIISEDRPLTFTPGAEVEIADKIKEYVSGFSNVETDNSGNLVATIEGSEKVFLLDAHMDRILLKGEITSPIEPPDMCRFHKRCFLDCAEKCCNLCSPKLIEISKDHFVACHECKGKNK